MGPGCLLAQEAQGNFDDAKRALKGGDYIRAETEFRALLDANPKSPELLDNLGIALHLQGKSQAAISIFERVIRLKRFPDAVALLALNYCQNHEFGRATPLLEEARENLEDPNILATLAPCFLEAGLPESAVFAYEKLVKINFPHTDENAINLIRAYFDLSRKLLDLLISIPQGVQYARVIEAAKNDGSLDAKSLFPKAYQAAPYLKVDMSIGDLIKRLGSHPRDPSLLYILGVKCVEQAAEDFEKAQQKWAGSIALSQLVAELKDSQGDRDGAILAYEEILASHADAPASIHFALGLLYGQRHRWEDALRQYRMLGVQNNGSLYVTQRICEALLRLGQDTPAIELLGSIVSNPDAPFWALRDMGLAEQHLGHEEIALKYFERARQLDQSDFTVHYHLSRIYRRLNKMQAAANEQAILKRLKQPQDAENGPVCLVATNCSNTTAKRSK